MFTAVTAVNGTTTLRSAGTCVELFGGLGGLAIGLGRAGWGHNLLVERDPHAVSTLRSNELTRH